MPDHPVKVEARPSKATRTRSLIFQRQKGAWKLITSLFGDRRGTHVLTNARSRLYCRITSPSGKKQEWWDCGEGDVVSAPKRLERFFESTLKRCSFDQIAWYRAPA